MAVRSSDAPIGWVRSWPGLIPGVGTVLLRNSPALVHLRGAFLATAWSAVLVALPPFVLSDGGTSLGSAAVLTASAVAGCIGGLALAASCWMRTVREPDPSDLTVGRYGISVFVRLCLVVVVLVCGMGLAITAGSSWVEVPTVLSAAVLWVLAAPTTSDITRYGGPPLLDGLHEPRRPNADSVPLRDEADRPTLVAAAGSISAMGLVGLVAAVINADHVASFIFPALITFGPWLFLGLTTRGDRPSQAGPSVPK